MKACGLWVIFLVFVTALICLSLPALPGHGEASMNLHKSRKLKEKIDIDGYEGDSSHIDLQDYRRINPVPSSKASIRPGPIQHGTPFMPYIPKDPEAPPPKLDHRNHDDAVFP